MNPTVLSVWVVYDRPKDYPIGLIARRWEISERGREPLATLESLVSSTLEGLRAKLPDGLTRLERSEADDPHIVEVWL